MLYVKLIQCSGLPYIHGQLEEGAGQSVMKLIWCSGLPEIYARLGVSLPKVSVHYAICETFGVVVFHGLWLVGGGWVQSVMKIIQCNGLPEIHA